MVLHCLYYMQGKLLTELWSGRYKSVAPRSFKQVYISEVFVFCKKVGKV